MPSVEKVSIALPPEMATMLRDAVETGEYASSSEVVREALREWSHRRALRVEGLDELRRVWQQAMDDKSPGVSPQTVFNRLERKYRAIAGSAGERL